MTHHMTEAELEELERRHREAAEQARQEAESSEDGHTDEPAFVVGHGAPVELDDAETDLNEARAKLETAEKVLENMLTTVRTEVGRQGVLAEYGLTVANAEAELLGMAGRYREAAEAAEAAESKRVGQPKALTGHHEDIYHMRRQAWKEDIEELDHQALYRRVEYRLDQGDEVDAHLISRFLPGRLAADGKRPKDAYDPSRDLSSELSAALKRAQDMVRDPAPQKRLDRATEVRRLAQSLERMAEARMEERLSPEERAVPKSRRVNPNHVPWVKRRDPFTPPAQPEPEPQLEPLHGVPWLRTGR